MPEAENDKKPNVTLIKKNNAAKSDKTSGDSSRNETYATNEINQNTEKKPIEPKKKKVVVVKKTKKQDLEKQTPQDRKTFTPSASATELTPQRVAVRMGNLARDRFSSHSGRNNQGDNYGERRSFTGSGQNRGGTSNGVSSGYKNDRGDKRPFGSEPKTGARPYTERSTTGRALGSRFGLDKNNFATAQSPVAKQHVKKVFKAKKSYTKEQELDEKLFEAQQPKHKEVDPAANVPASIKITEMITVSELARKMSLKASLLISKLMSMGMMVAMNQQIDAETAEILASEYNCKVHVVSLYDETVIESEEDVEGDLKPRPPVVTVMGHVDHGKTQTLDAIRHTNVVATEHGGITQYIGAYTVTTASGEKLTFLDTPGHEAFTQMRARGAKVTDIVVLVISATEGLMPQTLEALAHARAAEVPVIVAVNKMDLPDANIELVKKQLSEHDLVPEEWGGQTMVVPISALKKEGIDNLLQSILLQAEMMELKANYSTRAEGTILETRIDPGKGSAATVLIQRGCLHVGDAFVAGVYHGRVRAMFNDKGQRVTEAGPSDPVELYGLSDGLPDSGDPLQVTVDEHMASQVASKRQELKKLEGSRSVKKVTLDNLYDTIQASQIKELRVIIKGDVHGSIDALRYALERLSNDEVRLVVLHAAAGAIVEQDVKLASASNAIVIGFNVRPTTRAQVVADQEGVEIRKYNLIYEAVEDVSLAMEGLLSAELREDVTGKAEVRQMFRASKIGEIAGCMVVEGIIKNKSQIHVIREGIVLTTCKVNGLKRFNDDAREVKEGFECGITLEGFQGIKEGDTLEAFDITEVKRTMSAVSKKKKES